MINKYRVIFNLYIVDSYNELTEKDDVMKIYNCHYKMLGEYSKIVNEMIFILTHNNLSNEVLNKIKLRLLEECQACKSLTFIVEQNTPQYREGIIFKKYVIDKLNDYEGLTFWGHSKGVTNNRNINNLINTLKWLYIIYYGNLNWMREVKNKLDDNTDYITYGALYFKDNRHNLTYNWMYSGSIFWVNTKKLYKYIQDNNIETSDFTSSNNERLLTCAETFIGNIFDESHAAFHIDEHYNKSYEPFLNYGIELSYEYIDEQIKLYLKPWEYNDFLTNLKNMLTKLNISYE